MDTELTFDLTDLSDQDLLPLRELPGWKAIFAAAPAAIVVGLQSTLFKDIKTDLGQLLQFRPEELLSSAWAKARSLKELADPVRHPPDEKETHHLVVGEHEIRSTAHPTLEFRIEGRKSLEESLDLVLQLKMEAGDLTIRGGRVWTIGIGALEASAKLSWKGNTLCNPKTKRWQLPEPFHFREGIPIRSEHASSDDTRILEAADGDPRRNDSPRAGSP